jgi:protein phosphatase 1B
MRALPDVETGKDQSGSTAVMTLLSPTHLICSNTGDARALEPEAGPGPEPEPEALTQP